MQDLEEDGVTERPGGVTECIQKISKESWRNLEKTGALYVALSSALGLAATSMLAW